MPSRLRLDCLGSGYAFSDGRYWSGFLLDRRILLDCPPQTLVHLHKLGVATSEIELVLISHEHSDHIGGTDLFLLDAVMRTWGARTRPLAIAGPPGLHARLQQIVGPSERLPARDDPRIVWLEQRGGSAFAWAGALVQCFEMEHAPELLALGFRVTAPGGVVAYTGDTRLCDAVYRLAEGASVLIVECGNAPAHGHFSWDDVLQLRRALPASMPLLVTHYPGEAPEAVRAASGVVLAEDFGAYEYGG